MITPAGQEFTQSLGKLIGTQISSFVSTAQSIDGKIQDALEYFYQIQCTVVDRVQTVVDTAVAKAEADKSWNGHTVYVHYDTTNGKVYYVGRTNNFSRRYNEHSRTVLGRHTSKHPIGPDVGRDMIPIATGLTFTQSKVLEQVLISSFTLDALDNARNEFSKKNWEKTIEEIDRVIELQGSNVGLEGLL